MLDEVKKQIMEISDEEFYNTIPVGALKLDDNQRKTIEFIFWLGYMSERDLTDVIINAVEFSKRYSPVSDELNDYIKKSYKIDFKLLTDDFINTTMNFGGKLTIYRWLLGRNERFKLLMKIKRLRDNISHLRINNLFYKKKSIFERKTLELLLTDYFESSMTEDLSKSKIWQTLKEEDKKNIKNETSN